MSTKFVSKNSNYMIVLKPGVEGNRSLGTHAIPGLYIKFLSGVVDIKEESIANQLREHPAFGIEFVEVKDSEVDPYSDTREEVEPDHVIQEIKYGHAEGMKGSHKTKISPQMKKVIEAEALKMLPGLLKSNPEILKGILRSMAAELNTSDKKEESKEAVKEEKAEKAPSKTPSKE